MKIANFVINTLCLDHLHVVRRTFLDAILNMNPFIIIWKHFHFYLFLLLAIACFSSYSRQLNYEKTADEDHFNEKLAEKSLISPRKDKTIEHVSDEYFISLL